MIINNKTHQSVNLPLDEFNFPSLVLKSYSTDNTKQDLDGILNMLFNDESEEEIANVGINP